MTPPAAPKPRAQQPVVEAERPQVAPRPDAEAPNPRPAQAADDAARAAAQQEAGTPPAARPATDESAIRRALEENAQEQPAPRPQVQGQQAQGQGQAPAVEPSQRPIPTPGQPQGQQAQGQAPAVEITPGQQAGGGAPAPRPVLPNPRGEPGPAAAAQQEVTPGNGNGNGNRPGNGPVVETADPTNPEDMRRILEEQAQGGQRSQGAPAVVQEVAPETRVKPNDVAIRAAEEVSPVTAAALEAGAAATGQMQETAITPENIRTSDEDFRNRVGQPVVEAPGQQEYRDNNDDDDDDHLGDIAKLLLSGAAGMAVGSMLGNNRQVALNTGDRVVVSLPDGSQQVIRDDNALLYQPGSNVQTETFDDGSTRTTVLREDGSRVVTIRDANMNVLRRTLISPNGQETRLINDTEAQPVQISTLPAPPPVQIYDRPLNEEELRAALNRESAVDRRFSLSQIRDIPEVRSLVAPVDIPSITFDTGSAAITPDQAKQLSTLGNVIKEAVASNPGEIYMIEGYTDAIGTGAANLALSDRRAESVALALTEYFDVPPENLVVQGYGEQFLLVPTDQAERMNRRVAVRRITQLIAQN
ncbi:OmpA family protein [Paracoccus sulfuroxidans]|uniref:OmpA family protein n=1 Tax=Paracoccus sulfuroxidans TaxID=384678 RepID=UPI001F549919|nr:OmpA family protein [Paracoccus sulfuroxidans]